MNKPQPIESEARGGSPYVWEVLRLIPHPQDEKKHTRCSMLLAAETIEQVWEYLAADRADAATEIESIARLAPLVATLPPIPQPSNDQAHLRQPDSDSRKEEK